MYGSDQFLRRLWHSGVWSLHVGSDLFHVGMYARRSVNNPCFFASQVTRESSRQAQHGRVTREGCVRKFVVVYSGVASEDQILYTTVANSQSDEMVWKCWKLILVSGDEVLVAIARPRKVRRKTGGPAVGLNLWTAARQFSFAWQSCKCEQRLRWACGGRAVPHCQWFLLVCCSVQRVWLGLHCLGCECKLCFCTAPVLLRLVGTQAAACVFYSVLIATTHRHEPLFQVVSCHHHYHLRTTAN